MRAEMRNKQLLKSHSYILIWLVTAGYSQLGEVIRQNNSMYTILNRFIIVVSDYDVSHQENIIHAKQK